ncbi:MAG: tetratricopeptide repeat protein [Candidatus Krumholzibacteriia bacterium]
MSIRPIQSTCLLALFALLTLFGPARLAAVAPTDDADSRQRVEDLLGQARVARNDDPRVSLELANQARELAAAAGLTRLLIESLTGVGVSHYFLGNYPQALVHYQQAHDLATGLGDRKLQADALNNIGVIYFVWGEHDRALDYYFQALAIRLDMNDRRGIGQGYNNVANIYHTAGDYEQALTYYQQSLESYEAEVDTAMVTSSLNNIGLVYFDQARYDRSLSTYARALDMETRIDNKPGMAMTLNNMGQVYEARDALEEALTRYEQSLALRRDLGDRQGASVCLHNIGTIQIKQGRYDLGIDYLQRALAVTEELQIQELTRDNLEALSGAYEAAGRFEQALDYHKRYKHAYDDLFNEERTRQIALAQTRFEVDLKDREIQVLKREREIDRFRRQLLLVVAGLAVVIILLLLNRYLFQRRAHKQIARTNEALRAAHADLERAARDELAHVARVATMGELAAAFAHELNQPLAAIRANARAGVNYLERAEPDTAEVGAALADIGDDAERAQGIIVRLRDMMRKGNLKRQPVDLNQILADAVALVRAEAGIHGVALNLRPGTDLPPVLGDRIQLQQVVLNLLQNGMAVMDGRDGALRVTAERTSDGGVRVAVSDDGPPIDEDILGDMFEPFFTTKREGLGMGLPICRTIIEAHGGYIQAERREEGGLTVRFELPGHRV